MIVLDTNVLSEVLRPKPFDGVLRWLQSQSKPIIVTTSVSQAELLYGIEKMAQGRRRVFLAQGVEQVTSSLVQRILPFDEPAARAFAQIVAKREALGRPIGLGDAMIAAIVRANGASLATRDTRDFEHCGIPLINPWEAAADIGQ